MCLCIKHQDFLPQKKKKKKKVTHLTLISFYFKLLQHGSIRHSTYTENKKILPPLLVKQGPNRTLHCKNIVKELRSAENIAET